MSTSVIQFDASQLSERAFGLGGCHSNCEGIESFLRGLLWSANPYPKGSPDWKAWNAGYNKLV